MIAFAIDMLLKVFYIISLSYAIDIFGFNRFFGSDQWEMMVTTFIVLIPVLFYTLILETFFGGQTIGKRIMKIRVIKVDGYQASFADYFIRWILRFVEINIFMGSLAIVVIIFNDKNKRIGDIVAGTAVVSLRNKYQINHRFIDDITDAYQPVFQQVLRFSDNDIRIIRETYNRVVLSKDIALQQQLVAKIEETLQLKNPYQNPYEFINVILKDYVHLTSQTS